MPLLIDGHNLIGQMPDMKLSDPNDEEKLIKRLRMFGLLAQKQITVIFDPSPTDPIPRLYPEIQQHGPVRVIWAMPDQKADDLIRAMVANVKDKQGMLVVTSDNAVMKFVRVCGLKVQTSQEFTKVMHAQLAERIFADANAKPSPTRQEVKEWGEVFKEPEPDPKETEKQKLAQQAKLTAEQKQKQQAEDKRKRRAEQLAKQVKGGQRPLKANSTQTRKISEDDLLF